MKKQKVNSSDAQKIFELADNHKLTLYSADKKLDKKTILDCSKGDIVVELPDAATPASRIIGSTISKILGNDAVAVEILKDSFTEKEQPIARFLYHDLAKRYKKDKKIDAPQKANSLVVLANHHSAQLINEHDIKGAVELIQLLVDSGEPKQNMLNTQKWLLDNQGKYKIYTAKLIAKKRAKKTLAAAKIKKTRTWQKGRSACHNFKHEIMDKNNTIHIFEKIYSKPRFNHTKKELMLYEHISPDQILAPKFLGVHKSKNFHSIYYEYFDGRHPSDEEWQKNQLDILSYLWQIEPPKKLKNKPSFAIKKIETIIYDQNFEMLKNKRYKNDASVFIKNWHKIVESVEKLPKFIMHKDLHRENVLINEKAEIKLIDWEDWCVEPIGAGWPLNKSHSINDALKNRHHKHNNAANIASILWALHNHLKSMQFAEAHSLIKRLNIVASEGNIT